MLEIVTAFEQVYAHLDASRGPGPHGASHSDKPFSPFSGDGDQPHSERGPSDSRRVLRVWPEREIVRSVTPAGRVAPAPERPAEIELDEAMSILLDAEERGRAAATAHTQVERPGGRTGAPYMGAAPPPAAASSAFRAASEPARAADSLSEAARPTYRAWTTRSHRFQSFAIAGAAAALLVCIAAGYAMGRGSDGSPTRAKGLAPESGGTHLRSDYEIRPR